MSAPREPRLGPTRAEVLNHLRNVAEPVPVADVAASVGLHPNTTRFHLDALAASGLVVREVEQREQPGRPKVLYSAAHPHRESHYRDLAYAMVEHFAGGLEDRSARAEEAGRAWGVSLREELETAEPGREPLEVLVAAMTDLGYAPRLAERPGPVVELTPCPYGQLASDNPQVVCQLHLGLVRGLLGPGQPWSAVSIEPWAEPSLCLLRLARADEGVRRA